MCTEFNAKQKRSRREMDSWLPMYIGSLSTRNSKKLLDDTDGLRVQLS